MSNGCLFKVLPVCSATTNRKGRTLLFGSQAQSICISFLKNLQLLYDKILEKKEAGKIMSKYLYFYR